VQNSSRETKNQHFILTMQVRVWRYFQRLYTGLVALKLGTYQNIKKSLV